VIEMRFWCGLIVVTLFVFSVPAVANENLDLAQAMNARPFKLSDVQAALRPDQALIMLQDAPAELRVQVITRTEARWARSRLDTVVLMRDAAALRCTLNASAWEGDGAAGCWALLQFRPEKAVNSGRLLPVVTFSAPNRIAALLGEVADLIRGKYLLVVSSDAQFSALLMIPPPPRPVEDVKTCCRPPSFGR
jgi:hypothetical protein